MKWWRCSKEIYLVLIFLVLSFFGFLMIFGEQPKPVFFQSVGSSGLILQEGGSAGKEIGQLDYPRGLAVDEKGNVYVADSKNHRIQVFESETGKFLKKIGGGGTSDPGDLREPNDVSIFPDGRILAADTWNHRVQIYSPKGKFLHQVSPEDRFFGPRGVWAAPSGDFYVADTGRHRVFHFDREGKILRVWGKKGSAPGDFNEPIGLVQDTQKQLYVADRLNYRIQVFSENGDYVREFRVPGWSEEQINMEPHLALDPTKGILYVTDGRAARVIRMRLNGDFLGYLEKDDQNRALFQVPLGVAWAQGKGLYVSDAVRAKILLLQVP